MTVASVTALYRLYGEADQLLYVGIARYPEHRLATHAATKKWWSRVVRKTVDWYETRESAEQAELVAIKTESPLHNKRGKGPTAIRNLRVPDEIWEPALANARAEGKTITEVITAALKRYNTAANRRRQEEPPTTMNSGGVLKTEDLNATEIQWDYPERKAP